MASLFGELLKTARAESGLSQRLLAKKARTAQSVVARIESSETSPSWETSTRLILAAGFKLRIMLERIPVVNNSVLDDVPRILAMTPEQRLQEIADVSRLVTAAKRV
jgi:ribosome-binding protein aMBF1 (putative translation factor)